MSDGTALQDWIAAATAGLPPSAVSKISAEIADHAAESRAKHLAEGMSADEASAVSVRDLGDARQLAVTFRDAHFSRRTYARGAVFTLIFLLITGIAALMVILSPATGDDMQPAMISPWVALRQSAYILARITLFVLMIRAALVFLREQFDIPTPRLGWRLFIASVVLNTVPGLLRQLASAGGFYSHYAPLLARLTGLDFWYNPHPALAALTRIGAFATWTLIGVFCARLLTSRANRSRRVLSPLLILGAVAGGEIFLLYMMNFLSLPVNYYLARAAHLMGVSQNAASVLMVIPHLALEAMLLWLLMRMRRPGAVIAS